MKLVLLILLSAILATNVFAKNIPFRVCKGDIEFLPFTNLNDNGTWQLLLRDAAKRLPLELSFHSIPRNRCILEATTNSMSDALFVEKSEDSKKTLSFPTDSSYKIERLNYIILVSNDSDVDWDGTKFKNLKGKAIAIQKGRKYLSDLLDKIHENYEPALVSQNIEKLAKNKVSAMIIENQQWDVIKAKFSSYKFKILPRKFNETDVYLGVSISFYKKNKTLVDQLWENIKSIKSKFKKPE